MNARETVKKLDDLHQNLDAQLQLIMMGQEAVDALIEFLLSAPALHPQPRCLAAEALGAIGGQKAIDGLISALTINDVSDRDPTIRLAEEVVRNCAAEQLGQLDDRRAVEPLLEALGRFHLVGAAESLAKLEEARAIPLMIVRLEDSFSRERIGNALLMFGAEVQGALIETLSVKRLFRDEEARGSQERRAEAARLLGVLRSPKSTDPLIERLDDEVQEVRLQAALALCVLLKTDDHRIEGALAVLVRDSDCGDLSTRDRVFEVLVRMASRALPHLLRALEYPELSDDAKVLAIEVLAHIPDPRVPGALLSVLSSGRRTLHWKARWALQRLGRTTEPSRSP